MKSQELIELQHDLLQNLARNLPLIGMRCPMIGKAPDDFTWDYPEADGYFWTDSFFTGELWLAYMLTGEGKFRNCARMRDGHIKAGLRLLFFFVLCWIKPRPVIA